MPEAAKSNSESLKKLYHDMLLIRRFEERAGQLYGMGLIGGFCHLYIGQEAVVVGLMGAAKTGRPADHRLSRPWPYAGPGHRSQGGDGRTDGAAPPACRAARAARCTCSPARRNSMAATALSAPRCRSAPAWPSPTNIAAMKAVSLTYFGDGAANQGQVYESFNMAELWKLPVIYVIENNEYAMGTSRGALQRGDRFLQARRLLRHSRHPGGRHGCGSGAEGGRGGDGPLPRRQGPDHPGDEDLPLSRPFHVRPRPSTAAARK